MTVLQLETQLTEIDMASSIPAIEAINQYMLRLSNDFPIQSFFKSTSIKQVVAIDPIYVIYSRSRSKYECISGIRAIKTLHAYNIPSCLVNLVQEESTRNIIQLAIRNNILPLVYWPVALSNNIRSFQLLDGLRRQLPAEYKDLIPSTSSLKKTMYIKKYQGRRSSQKKSDLEILIESVG